jgi:glycosyltransferase involved in cell wall biosynthesis
MAAVGSGFLQGAARVIFATNRERDKALATVSGMRSHVVPWPVEVPPLVDRERERHEWRRQMGIPEESRVLVSVSRLHSMKRPYAILDAFMAAAASNCVLVMVGGDDDLSIDVLRQRIPSAWCNRIFFTGQIDQHDLRRVMHASDGLISLSYRENYAYSVADALAHGLPVILTPGHDLAHDMPRRSDGRFDFGWLLEDLSQHAATAAIREFADVSASWLTNAGSRARAWASEVLSEEGFVSALKSLV